MTDGEQAIMAAIVEGNRAMSTLLTAIWEAVEKRPMTPTERSRKWRSEHATKSVASETTTVAPEHENETKPVASPRRSEHATKSVASETTTEHATKSVAPEHENETKPVASPKMGEGTIGVGEYFPSSLGFLFEDQGDVPEVGNGVNQVEGKGIGSQDKNARSLENATPAVAPTTDDDWPAFRKAFPNQSRRTVWTETEKAWGKLKPSERAAAVMAVPNYAACRDVLRGCEMAAIRWLKEKRWQYWQEPEAYQPPIANQPMGRAQTALEAWRRQMDERDACIEGEVIR